jgi:hypothetical protein
MKTLRLVLSLAVAFQTVAVAAQTKAPVPAPDAQEKATTLVREVYKSEYEKAQTSEAKEELARRLIERAAGTSDATQRYALLRVARDISVEVGGRTAFEAVDRMAAAYQVDRLDMSAKILAKLSATAIAPPQHKLVAEKAISLVDEALATEQLATAGQLSGMALSAARKARDMALVKQAVALGREVQEWVEASDDAAAALKTLEANPADPDANLAVGRYVCFRRGDWQKGLPMLARGSDAALKGLAIEELKNPLEPAGQVALGDGWWDWAEKAAGREQTQLRARTAHWYRQALPGLSGLVQEKVQKRLREIDAARQAPASADPKPSGAAKEPQVLGPIPLDVKQPWSYVLKVKKGQTIHITATGRWRVLPKGKWHLPGDEKFYVQGQLSGGAPFKVGSDSALVVPQDGILTLGMREGADYSNNSGNVRVTIVIEE